MPHVPAPNDGTVILALSTIRLAAIVPGLWDHTFNIDRQASLSMVLTIVRKRMVQILMPPEFTAYTAQQDTGAWILRQTPEYTMLRRENEDAVGRFVASEKPLDPTKTVMETFDKAPEMA